MMVKDNQERKVIEEVIEEVTEEVIEEIIEGVIEEILEGVIEEISEEPVEENSEVPVEENSEEQMKTEEVPQEEALQGNKIVDRNFISSIQNLIIGYFIENLLCINYRVFY